MQTKGTYFTLLDSSKKLGGCKHCVVRKNGIGKPHLTKVHVLALWLLEQSPTPGWLIRTDIYSLRVLEIRVWDQGVRRAVLSEGSRGGCLFQLLVAPGVSWFVAESLQSWPLSSHGLLLCFLCFCLPQRVSYKGTCDWIQGPPAYSRLISSWDPELNYICKASSFLQKVILPPPPPRGEDVASSWEPPFSSPPPLQDGFISLVTHISVKSEARS